jgi:ATPase family AAA domain-containing protein 3A/B
VLEGIRLAGTTLGAGVQNFLTDPTKLSNTAITLTAVAFGISIARVSTGVAGRVIEARLGKPSLVRETSRHNILSAVRSPQAAMRRYFGNASTGSNAMKDIVLPRGLEERLQRVAVSTSNTKKNKAPFRHLLLYGPPGTG